VSADPAARAKGGERDGTATGRPRQTVLCLELNGSSARPLVCAWSSPKIRRWSLGPHRACRIDHARRPWSRHVAARPECAIRPAQRMINRS